MKITCGLGSIDDYEIFAKAGADECFLGYVPGFWMEKFGARQPLNRREVLYYNVQIGSFSELMILQDMVQVYQVPVTAAINAIHFTREQREMVPKVLEQCLRAGIRDVILADEELIGTLSLEFGRKISIHVSGELGEMNSLVLDRMEHPSVSRIIFPRQTTLEEMEHMICLHPKLEYEAFLLNEKCHFTGAYCNSLHCDEFCHACLIPYRLTEQAQSRVETGYEGLGATGCGLCNLWRLNAMGVTHVKLVSRGNDTRSTMRDILAVRKAIDILQDSATENDYVERMKLALFPHGCSHNCYAANR